MANITCAVCEREFDNDRSFHSHLTKVHTMTQAEYYQTNYPRHDLFDGSLIKYKSKDFYFNSEFNSKINFKKWLLSRKPEEAKAYVIDYLTKRKLKKGLIFSPTQVELKTLMLPGIKYINENLGGYDEICKSVGLKIRFKQEPLDLSKLKDISKKVIFTDSREKLPLDFDNRTKVKCLPFGDYKINSSDIYIERKSLADAWGTLSGGFKRFEREIIRAKNANAYLVILVEEPLSSLENFPYQRKVYGKIKIPVEVIYHNIRELFQKYESIQFLFVKNREEASRMVQLLFSLDEKVKTIDLQYYYDIDALNYAT